MAFQIRKRGPVEVKPEFRMIGDNKIIGSAEWTGGDERFQVLTIRDGKIVDMQGCRSLREAERFARRH